MSKAGLPVVTVARFEAATTLIECLADENTDLFIGKMQSYRERSRSGTSRALTAQEAAGVAAGLAGAMAGDDPVGIAERVQSGGLRAVDEPGSMEVLLAAGVATAPAFLRAALRLVALIEMPADEFEQAYEGAALDAALDAAVAELKKADLEDARERAVAALDHLGSKAGVGSGEGLRLLTKTVWQALNQAAAQMAPGISSGLSSLTGSLEPTDGTSDASSTDSPSAGL